jgi:hypothetical protein
MRNGFGGDLIMGDTKGVMNDVGGPVLQWLQHKADGEDADVFVRQFAHNALRDWREKLTMLSDGR